VLAGTGGIAAGGAWQLKECFIGDGAEEEAHFYESVLFVQGNELPCTFIIEAVASCRFGLPASDHVQPGDRRGSSRPAFVQHWKFPLMPDGIRGRHVARRIEHSDLGGRQLPADSAQVVDQLSLGARPDDEARDRGPLQ
jgi:hypothetical protein